MNKVDSYIICSTPRTGSTILCALLNSTEMAGHPESYFRAPDMKAYAEKWGIQMSAVGTFSYADYLKAVLGAGATENGIFAVRIMWGTMEEVVRELGEVYPALAGKELKLLQLAFGRVHFVYLQREDVVSQAVSWLRAEQTDVWHKTTNGESGVEIEAKYSFDELDKLVCTINEHNTAWRSWFKMTGIQPHAITYEQLDANPKHTIHSLLDFLELDPPIGRELKVRNKRLADSLSARWAERYRSDLAKYPDGRTIT